MDNVSLARRLGAAVEPHRLLAHPFYQAWNRGELTLSDLRSYAAQYRHQVDVLPELLGVALRSTDDATTRASLQRNLDEEEGRAPENGVAHRTLWLQFAEGVGVKREDVIAEPAHPETAESMGSLRSIVGDGELQALAALWAYEGQTAEVSHTKLEGLRDRYDVDDPRALAFFALHRDLDVHHANDLLDALARCCARAEEQGAMANPVEEACRAAVRAVRAQGRFLDGAEARRVASA